MITLENYKEIKREIKEAGSKLEQNISLLFYLTEGDNLKFTAYDEFNTKIEFKAKNGKLNIRGSGSRETPLYSIDISRKTEKKRKKEKAKGLPEKELEVVLADFAVSPWWCWIDSVNNVFGKYSEAIFGDRRDLVKDQVKRLASLQTAILGHFESVDHKKEEIIKGFDEANAQFDKAIDIINCYNSDPNQFKKLFAILAEEKKKEVLRKVIQNGQSNEELNHWLTEKYPRLIDDAGRDHCLSADKK